MKFDGANHVGGRPPGAKNKLQRDFLEALAKDFADHGEAAIKIVRIEQAPAIADKKRAFEALLRKDLERRSAEKFAKGECVVIGVSREEAMPHNAAVIITGVPRAGRDDDYVGATMPPQGQGSAYRQGTRAQGPPHRGLLRPPACERSDALRGQADAQHSAPGVIVGRGAGRAACGVPHTSTGRAADRRRSGRGHRGKLHACRDGVLRVYDADRNLLGTERLKLGEDPARVARQLLRKKQGNGFDRRIEYPNLGIV